MESTLSGVIEGRGKFIKQRRRVSITELIESRNKLISLAPVAASSKNYEFKENLIKYRNAKK